MTLAAGTIIKAQGCADLRVNGSLVANGTALNPVVFTSIKDDSVGGMGTIYEAGAALLKAAPGPISKREAYLPAALALAASHFAWVISVKP